MSVSFKTVIRMFEKEMGNILAEKGYKYDNDISGGDTVSYTKYKDEKHFEEIAIFKSYLEPFIEVSVSSNIRGGFVRLDRLVGGECKMRWSITTKEKAEESVKEIAELINKYAWDWLTLAD